jgi:hypothetical protein
MRELGLGLGWELSAGGVAIPAGAVLVPADSGLEADIAIGTFDNWSAGAWFRIDSLPEQYASLFVIQKQTAPGVNQYFWLGHDTLAGGGNRGLSVADNQGAHSYQLLPTPGTWFHVGITKNGTTVKVYQNGALVDWDTAAPATNYSVTMGQSSYVNIEKMRWCNENAAGQDFVGAIRSAFYVQGTVLSDAQMAAIRQYSKPQNYIGGLTNAWELPSASDLSGSNGSITAFGSALGNTTKPAGIIFP